jgi:hypothetical protein
MAAAAKKAKVEEPDDAGVILTGGERAPQLLPLSSLSLCEGNVRRGSKGELEQLAADIAAHGLLQNLTGTLAEDGRGALGEPTVRIIAGGRRLRALQMLADNTLVRRIVGKAKAWLPREMMWGGQ